MKKIYGMFGVEMRAYGQKLVKLRCFALAFIHSHSGATGVFRNAFREFAG